MHSKILKFKYKKTPCDNQALIDEIVNVTVTENGSGKLFLRSSKCPLVDLRVGFSASHFMRDPYANSFEKACCLMHCKETEDDYFIPKELYWKKGSDYAESEIFKHHLFTSNITANTCLPVYDQRVGRYIVNPEFGLSAYLIENDGECIIEKINVFISSCYIYSRESLKDWHLFKAENYHHGDSDSHKDTVKNSDKIVCMLNAQHIISIDKLFELNISKNKESDLIF